MFTDEVSSTESLNDSLFHIRNHNTMPHTLKTDVIFQALATKSCKAPFTFLCPPCEKELDIDNKLHNHLKIAGILNDVFRP